MKKRIACLLLVLIMLLSAFAFSSCGEDSKDNSSVDGSTATGSTDSTESSNEGDASSASAQASEDVDSSGEAEPRTVVGTWRTKTDTGYKYMYVDYTFMGAVITESEAGELENIRFYRFSALGKDLKLEGTELYAINATYNIVGDTLYYTCGVKREIYEYVGVYPPEHLVPGGFISLWNYEPVEGIVQAYGFNSDGTGIYVSLGDINPMTYVVLSDSELEITQDVEGNVWTFVMPYSFDENGNLIVTVSEGTFTCEEVLFKK